MFITITPAGELTRHDQAANAQAIQEQVGPPGFDIVQMREPGKPATMCAFVNDEGFRLGLERNPVGACVIASLGARTHIYAGTIVVTGWDSHANGPEITDLTDKQGRMVERIHRYVGMALGGDRIGFEGAPDWSEQMREYAEHVRTAPAPTLTVTEF